MNEFKVGDKVRRIIYDLPDMLIGWEDVVSAVDCGGRITLLEDGGYYDPDYFELVEEDTSKRRCHYAERIAHAEGAEIEYYLDIMSIWVAVAEEPSWGPDTKYRVKPPTPVPTKQEVEIDRIESEMRKLADDLKELKK